MLGGTPAPASSTMTFLRPLPSSFAIRAPANPEPMIATSHTRSDSAAMIGLLGDGGPDEIFDVVRRTGPIAELHFAEAHGMRLRHPQRPCLGIGFRRDDLERRNPFRVLAGRLQLGRLVPSAQVPHQNDAARE